MDREKLIKQLFIGKVADVIGMEKTAQLLKEATQNIDEAIEKSKKIEQSSYIDAIKFLREKGILGEVQTKWMVKFSNGNEVDLVHLFQEFAAKEKEQWDKQSEQFKCHSCGTNHSGKNNDQLFEVCKTCFDGI